MNRGNHPTEEDDITLPETMKVVSHRGDGTCLFHAMSYLLHKLKGVEVTGDNLRLETADFIEQNKHVVLKNRNIGQWVSELQGEDVRFGGYANQLRKGMWGGTLEILVVDHVYGVHFMVFTKCVTGYKCIMDTETVSDNTGYLWLHDNHYDSLECNLGSQSEGSERKTEVESPDNKMDIDFEVTEEVHRTIPPSRFQKKRIQRNKLSLTRTTTQYNHHCGKCGEFHTRRRASILCECGQYVHLKCLGFRTVEDFFFSRYKSWFWMSM
jgi:hypothetical protein